MKEIHMSCYSVQDMQFVFLPFVLPNFCAAEDTLVT